jgi:DNA helicase II / ATP-dependent DNA helicase PcrA
MGIPNQFVSLRGLYLKPMIIDVISYMRLLDNYHESAALFRVLNMEVFKVSHSDLVAINKFARSKSCSLYEALENINAIPGVTPESAANISALISLIAKHSLYAKNESPSQLYVRFVYDSGLLKGLDHDRDQEIFDYLNQFYKKIKEVESSLADMRLKDFLELFNMEEEAGETGSLKMNYTDIDTVKIMTVHGAKGLEFKYVFIVNLVDKKFPTISRGEKIPIPDALVREILPEGDTHLEEERRLFYVALTRARDRLFLTSASDYGGARDKKVSKFVGEAGFETEKLTKIKIHEIGDELLDAVREEARHPAVNQNRYELPAKFSFSQLEAFSNCPLQYKFGFILKIPIPEKASLVFGKLMHDTLRDFLLIGEASGTRQQELFGKPGISANDSDTGSPDKELPSLDDLLKIYEDNWKDSGYRNFDEKEKYKKKGRSLLKIFYENLEKDGWPEVKFIEKNFTAKIGGYMLRGAIDRVDDIGEGRFEIIDYKTGSPKDSLQFSDKKQLILYKVALEDLFKINASKLSYHYLENGEKLSFEAKDKDIEKLKSSTIAQIEEIKKCNFIPKPGPLCAFCDFRGICEFRK